MPHFKSTIPKSTEERITERLLELFETTRELKDLFNSVLPNKESEPNVIGLPTCKDGIVLL